MQRGENESCCKYISMIKLSNSGRVTKMKGCLMPPESILSKVEPRILLKQSAQFATPQAGLLARKLYA